jgi:hypothetical protein
MGFPVFDANIYLLRRALSEKATDESRSQQNEDSSKLADFLHDSRPTCYFEQFSWISPGL